jgi:hypothetical protein
MGGGRWQTRDGRFRIEPQSGTWVIVDAEQTDDLGLPLVRGPFPSLTAARDAIEEARDQGASVSPLADLVEAARSRPPTTPPGRSSGDGTKRTPKPESKEPAWLARLDDAERRAAQRLVRRLEKAGVPGAVAIARAELVDDRPALARLVLERRLRDIVASADDAEAMARAIVELLVSGRDAALDVGWRLTDAAGRPIRDLSVTDEP